MAVRRRHIRSLVSTLLSDLGIEHPPVEVEEIAKHLGATVQLEPGGPDLSGFLLRDEEYGTIIGVNDSHHENRQRFTIAHEIGHLLLHAGERLHVDRAQRGYQVMRRDEVSSQGTDESEIEANVFAAELLMPKAFLEADIEAADDLDLLGEDDLADMAKRYRVSTQALTFRLANLGYIRP